MSDILSRLKSSTVALLRGGLVPELTVPASEPSAAAGAEAAVAAALANAQAAGAIGASAEAGGGKKKDKAGRMPGDEGYDENDPAEDEPEASAPVAGPPKADPVAAAVQAEQARWAAVLGSPEMQGREALGQSLLSTTTLSADSIIAQLKAAPKANAAQSVAAMLGHDNPDLGAGGGASADRRPGDVWDKVHARRAELNR